MKRTLIALTLIFSAVLIPAIASASRRRGPRPSRGPETPSPSASTSGSTR